MIHGANPEELERNSSSNPTRRNANPAEFAIQISKIAVSQILQSAGFDSAHRSALDSLADVTLLFLRHLAKSASFHANLAHRTSPNEFDILQSLQDLEPPQRIPHCLVGSTVVQELIRFIDLQEEEIPFARPIPKFPVLRKSGGGTPSFAQIGEVSGKKEVPGWLPAFPDVHTWRQTPVWNERGKDRRAEKVEQARQRRKAERSLLSLEKRIADSSVGTASCGLLEGKGKNPFLAVPLPAGEKNVAEIMIPNGVGGGGSSMGDGLGGGSSSGEKRLSVLETFEPVIVAAKSGNLDGGLNEKRGEVLKRRPTKVHSKFGGENKSVSLLPVWSSRGVGGKKDSWFLRDDEKDDKKRRAEMILKEAMENPQELNQL